MSAERNLLASCMQSRDAYNSVADHIEKGDISEQGQIIFEAIAEYYSRDTNASHVDGDLLARNVGRSLSSDKHRQMFGKLISSACDAKVSPANVIHDYIAVKREAAGDRLASALAARKGSDAVRPLLDEYSRWQAAETLEAGGGVELASGIKAVDLVKATSEEGLIRVWPKALNDRLDGGLRRGHHMLVFARPEMGKTMMLVNMMAGYASQGLRVLYVGNEDPQADIMERVLCRMAKVPKVELYKDPETVDALAEDAGYYNITFMDAAPGTPRQIIEAVKQVEPDVILIDQLRNLNVGEEQFVQKLEKAAIAARNIAKEFKALVVSVTQAGASAEGKAVLDMGDVDSSNTGIPAAVDVMVGLGGTQDDIDMNRRVLSLPKNKRSGRHEFFPVRVDPALAIVRNAS